MVSTKVLIIGGSSFIGKNLLEQAPASWDITATYCTSKDFIGFCKKFKNVTPVQLDVVKDEINPADYDTAYDSIIYIAANSDPRKSLTDPLNDLAVNAMGVVRVCEKISCKKFVYFSSGAAYLKEKIPYTISKRAGEEYAQWFAQQKGFGYVIVRLFEAFGPYSPARKVFRRVAEALERGERSFTVYGDGKNLVDPMYAEDTARAVITIAESPHQNVIVDLCTGRPMTVNEAAERIAKVYKVPLELRHEGQAVEKVFFNGNPAPMKKLFGFEPGISFEEGVERWRKRKLI